MPKTYRLALAAFATTAVLAACGGGGGGGSGSGGTGVVNLRITDAPVDEANAVVVQFTGVVLKRAGSDEQVFTFNPPRTLDLLALQSGTTAPLLNGVTVPAGNYEWIRLEVRSTRDTTDSYLEEADSTRVPLFVPSGSQSGLKLVSGFTVPTGGTADFTIDFDLRKSVTAPQSAGAPYVLKPALRLVDNVQAGSIAGTVSSATLTTGACATATGSDRATLVYVFPAGTTPNDLGGNDTDAVTVATVAPDAGGTWRYTAAFLPAGSYRVAFTCEGGKDRPETVEALTFTGAQDVTVTARSTTTADF